MKRNMIIGAALAVLAVGAALIGYWCSRTQKAAPAEAVFAAVTEWEPRRILVGGESFDAEAEKIVLPACDAEEFERLSQFPNLTEADVTACTDDAAAYEAAAAIPEITFIRDVTVCGERWSADTDYFDLSSCEITGPEDLSGLAYLNGPATVDLGSEIRSVEDLTAIREAYPNVTLLSAFTLESVGYPKITVNGSLEELDLSGKKIEDLDALRNCLNLLPNLKKLVLCNCGRSNEELAELREDYPDIKVVWTVYLNWQYKLRTDAVSFSTLVHEDEEHAMVTSEGCEVLKYCTDLLALDLGHQAVTDLSFLYYLPNLRVLILAENSITDITPIASLTELRYLELFMNYRIESYEPLRNLQHLTDLNLSWDHGTTDYEPLWSIPTLERLWMTGCRLTKEDRETIKANVPEGCECYLTGYDESTGGGWRYGAKYRAIYNTFHHNCLDELFMDDSEKTQ